MNMTLSKRGDYVVRSALALARAWPSGEQRKIREVVAEMGVPPTFASQILADLVRAGLAVSKAGKDGGYRLARPPEEISILSVVEAGEGPLRSERCALGDGPCRWDAVCPLHETWRAATDALRLALEASTLAELAERDRMLGDGEVGAPADSHRHGTTSVEVEDWIHVEQGIEAVADCLHHDDRLVRAVAGAYAEADAVRSTVVPSGVPWAPVQVAVACALLPEPGDQQSDVAAAFAVSWEALGPGGSNSHADVEITVRAVDPQRTELRLVGRLRGPSIDETGPAEAEVTERLGQIVVRSMLRYLARELEGATPVSPSATVRRGRRTKPAAAAR